MPKKKQAKSQPKEVKKDEKQEGEDYGRKGTPSFGGKVEVV